MATYTWDGTDGSYDSAADWSPNAVPGSGDTAIINAGTVQIGTPFLSSFAGGETVLLSGNAELDYNLSNLDFLTGNTFILPADAASAATTRLGGFGILDVDGGNLTVGVPVVSQTGIEVGIGTLEFAGPVAAGIMVDLDGDQTPVDRQQHLTGGGILKLDQPSSFAAVLGENFATGIPVGSGVDLANITANAVSFAPGSGSYAGDTMLQARFGSAVVASIPYDFSGLPLGFSVTPDGAGGTLIRSELSLGPALNLALPGNFAAYTITATSGVTIAATAGSTDFITPGNALSFLDGTLYFTAGSPGADIYRLYQTLLDRSPDSSGRAYWDGAEQSGASLAQIASGFMQSPEYQGGGLTDAQFVSDLYENALGRAPEAQGDAYWNNLLAQGDSRGDVVASFIGTAEALQHSAATIMVTGEFDAVRGI